MKIPKESKKCFEFFFLQNNRYFFSFYVFIRTYRQINLPTCVCEQSFSIIIHYKSKIKSRLDDLHLEAVLRIATSSIKPDI